MNSRQGKCRELKNLKRISQNEVYPPQLFDNVIVHSVMLIQLWIWFLILAQLNLGCCALESVSLKRLSAIKVEFNYGITITIYLFLFFFSPQCPGDLELVKIIPKSNLFTEIVEEPQEIEILMILGQALFTNQKERLIPYLE